MRPASIALMLLALLFTGACADDAKTTTAERAKTTATAEARDLTPEELGELGASIEKEPANAEQILSSKGLTEESFEQAIRRVAEDPDASKRYAEAYKRARA